MIKKILRVARGTGDVSGEFDPASLNDPVALQTDWTPLEKGGASFRTHQLSSANPARLEFRPTIGALSFGLIFLGIGLVVLLGLVLLVVTSEDIAIGFELAIPVIFGLIFSGSGAGMLYAFLSPVVFDLQKGLFWKGWKDPASLSPQQSAKL